MEFIFIFVFIIIVIVVIFSILVPILLYRYTSKSSFKTEEQSPFETEYQSSFEIEYQSPFETEYQSSFEIEYQSPFETEYHTLLEIEDQTLNKIRGKIGENQVAYVLKNVPPYMNYVFNDLLIVNENKSCQIDHVVVTQYGIFVIETKNHAGRIYGNEYQRYWTQVLAYGDTKHKVYNPLLQNKSHIYHLKQVLGRLVSFDDLISIVVFPKAELMIDNIPNVGGISVLEKQLLMHRPVVFAVNQVNAIYNKLNRIKNNPKITDNEHIENIKKDLHSVENNICPRCGRRLVLRKGTYGSFYGCSGYPYCKFKKNIM